MFPQAAHVGQPFTVHTRNQGPLQTVTVWFEGNSASAWHGTAPAGRLRDEDLVLTPTLTGTFRLFAKASDDKGCERDRTATPRLVIVGP